MDEQILINRAASCGSHEVLEDPRLARKLEGPLATLLSSAMPFANDPLQWSQLIVEQGATPLLLDDASFRTWMRGRRVFISSAMDDEMKAARDAARVCLEGWGAVPVMWEAITPRDQQPERAYLEGVESSALLILLLGERYGVPDDSGYSPTHKEANRARERQIPRLLFVRAQIRDAARAGRLNDWLRELYQELAAAQYRNPEDLCLQLEQRLRELAGQQESLWLKLGPVVFPGRVSERRSSNGVIFTVTARVRDSAVRRAMSSLGGSGPSLQANRLTWNDRTEQVSVSEVHADTTQRSESDVVITCTQARGGQYGFSNPITYSSQGRSYGPAEQAALWARRAVFAEGVSERGRIVGIDMLSQMTAHEGPTLVDVLRAQGAQGWLAEGLTRLFIAEHFTTKYGGHFERLDVGPATATAVRVDAEFMIDRAVIPITGAVPLG